MNYIYILFSKKDKMLYTGLTNNLKHRLKQHRLGEVKSTQNRRPLELIYFESYHFKEDAKRREKYLKGGNGRASLKIQLQKQLEHSGYKYL